MPQRKKTAEPKKPKNTEDFITHLQAAVNTVVDDVRFYQAEDSDLYLGNIARKSGFTIRSFVKSYLVVDLTRDIVGGEYTLEFAVTLLPLFHGLRNNSVSSEKLESFTKYAEAMHLIGKTAKNKHCEWKPYKAVCNEMELSGISFKCSIDCKDGQLQSLPYHVPKIARLLTGVIKDF